VKEVLTAVTAVEEQTMKCMVLIALLLLLSFAVPARAQDDELFIYSDAALTQSSLHDNTPRTVTMYVAGHLFGSAYLRFAVKPTSGFTGVWLGDTSSFAKIGQSPTDIQIAFDACIYSTSFVVLTISYQLFGTSEPCSELRTAPADGFTTALTLSNCGFAELPVKTVSSIRVNCAVATEPTTWGKVKSLYRS
jgi:hypothetical protein